LQATVCERGGIGKARSGIGVVKTIYSLIAVSAFSGENTFCLDHFFCDFDNSTKTSTSIQSALSSALYPPGTLYGTSLKFFSAWDSIWELNKEVRLITLVFKLSEGRDLISEWSEGEYSSKTICLFPTSGCKTNVLYYVSSETGILEFENFVKLLKRVLEEKERLSGMFAYEEDELATMNALTNELHDRLQHFDEMKNNVLTNLESIKTVLEEFDFSELHQLGFESLMETNIPKWLTTLTNNDYWEVLGRYASSMIPRIDSFLAEKSLFDLLSGISETIPNTLDSVIEKLETVEKRLGVVVNMLNFSQIYYDAEQPEERPF
jgi:hypothetical protein